MRIMLLTDVPPCKNFTAGIVLNLMCDFLLELGHEVCCFTVKNKFVDAAIPEDKLSNMKFRIVEKPREDWGLHTFGAVSSFIGNNMTAISKLPGIAKQAGDFAKENNVELIWSVVQGQTMIKITEPVAQHAGCSYVIQVWDPPEWWMRDNKFDSHTQASVMKSFANALKHSSCCLAASWAMAEDYALNYNCKAIPVILGFSPERVLPSGNKNENEFVIALSGQIYAENEFQTLLHALDLMNWTCNNRKIKIRLYGRYFHLYFSAPSNVEVCGWLEQECLLPELADADLLYCPYWFSDAFQRPARLSFPGKLSTYLKTAVPVLIHAPEYASPRKYLAEHEAGYVCGSLNPEEMKSVLTCIIESTEKERHTVGERGYQAFLNTLTIDRMRKNFYQALGIISIGDKE